MQQPELPIGPLDFSSFSSPPPPTLPPPSRPSQSAPQQARAMTAILLRDVRGSFELGLKIAWEGFCGALRCPAVRRVYRQSLIYWAVICGVIYFVGLMFFVPVYIILYFVDLLFRLGLWDLLPSVWLLLGQTALAIPMVGGLFIRYIYPKPFQEIFFATLSPSTREMLEKLTYPDLQYRTVSAIRKICRAIVLGLALLLLSYLPWIGFLVFPLAQFYSTYQQLGRTLAGIVVSLSLVPGLRPLWLVAVAFGWSARAICLELMDPYLGRLKVCDRMAVKEFLAGNNQLVVVSFALPFTSLVAIPFFGPLALPLFQSSAALLVEKLANKTTLKRLCESAPPSSSSTKTD